MSLPRRDVSVYKRESPLGAVRWTNPDFPVNVGPGRAATIGHKPGDLLEMVGLHHLPRKGRDLPVHKGLPSPNSIYCADLGKDSPWLTRPPQTATRTATNRME